MEPFRSCAPAGRYRDQTVNEEPAILRRWTPGRFRRPSSALLLAMAMAGGVLAGCGSSSGPAGSASPATGGSSASSTTAAEPSTAVSPTSAGDTASTASPITGPPSTAGSSTVSSPPSSTAVPDTVRHVFPAAGKPASYGPTHHDYPATDIFAACGSAAVSPVDGLIVHWRPEDPYDAAADNPAFRGGRSAAILGDDGVRYYLSHFESLEPGLGVGSRVDAGDRLGAVGRSGNAENVDCHIHFGLSPDCPAREWSVRRGVIWPAPYLDDWRNARNTSPVDEIRTWAAAHPTACADAAGDPTAADAG